MTDRPILVECPACEGAGVIEHHTGRRMDMRAEAIIDEGYVEPCQWCGGAGAELVEALPVQCSDLAPPVPSWCGGPETMSVRDERALLLSRILELETALMPFAKLSARFGSEWGEDAVLFETEDYGGMNLEAGGTVNDDVVVTVGNLRDAARVLPS